MKSSFFKIAICTSLIILATGCGKDNASGSKSSNAFSNLYNSSNPFFQNPTQETERAISNAKAWFSSNAENGSPGQKTEQRDSLAFNAPNCRTKTVLGFIDIELCKSSEISKTPLVPRTVNATLSTNKSSNAKLVSAFSPVSGATLSSATETNSPMNNGGRLFRITYIKPNGHILQYLIDTGLNSAFNPVEIYDSELSKGELVTNPFQLR